VPGTDGQIQRYELLSHPAFARFSSLRLFPVSKKNDSEERDSSLESSSLPKQAYFEGKLDESYYSDGLKKLKNRWIKCIKLKGDYEK